MYQIDLKKQRVTGRAGIAAAAARAWDIARAQGAAQTGHAPKIKIRPALRNVQTYVRWIYIINYIN